MRQKYNFCCVWSRRHWKSIATRSPFFMCLNKHGGEIIIRWTKWLLKCYWKVENVVEVQRRWRVEFGYTITNKSNNNKNPRQVWSRWNGARCVESSVRKEEKRKCYGVPDLISPISPIDVYLWGTLKNTVYATKPQTLEELRDRIEHAINDIPLATIQTVCRSVRRRC